VSAAAATTAAAHATPSAATACQRHLLPISIVGEEMEIERGFVGSRIQTAGNGLVPGTGGGYRQQNPSRTSQSLSARWRRRFCASSLRVRKKGEMGSGTQG